MVLYLWVMLIVDFIFLLFIICFDVVCVMWLVYVLVEEWLVVCVICLEGVYLMYCWQGWISEDFEVQLLIKIIGVCLDVIIVCVQVLYLYEFFECIVVEICVGLLVYLDWIWVQICEESD